MLSKDMNNQENQKKQNGNRRYSILLLALLFIGMATYGTYAYFTDSTSVNGNIKLETGTVELETKEGQWIYNPEGKNTAIDPKESDFDFTNVQPGDSFTKIVTVQYKGSLDGMVKVNQFTPEQNIEGLVFEINVDGTDVTKNGVERAVVQDETFTVTLTATLPIGDEESHSANEENRNNKVDKVIDLTALEKAVEISVVQLGAPTQTQQ